MTLLQALRRRTGGVYALLVALLLLQAGAQWRALQHAVVHGGVPAPVAATLATADEGTDWGHAAGDAECRLVDALLALAPGGDDPATPAAPLPSAAPVAPPAAAQPAFASRPYDARAPPAGAAAAA